MICFQTMQCIFSHLLSIILRQCPESEYLVRILLSVSCFTPSSLPISSHFCCAGLNSCTSKSHSVKVNSDQQRNTKYLCLILIAQLFQHITYTVINKGIQSICATVCSYLNAPHVQWRVAMNVSLIN